MIGGESLECRETCTKDFPEGPKTSSESFRFKKILYSDEDCKFISSKEKSLTFVSSCNGILNGNEYVYKRRFCING